MGCKTSKFSDEHEHFHGLYSRPDTPSIYSTHTRTPPSHSRDNSLDYGSGMQRPPMLQSQFSDSFYVNKYNVSSHPQIVSKGNGSRDPEKMGGARQFCNHPRQGNNPCFVCLREKPKPRKHKSRRNAQVMIPRASYYGRRDHSRSSSIEAPLRPEEQPPWVTARHGVFVPVTVANQLNASITQHEREEGQPFQSFRTSQESGDTVVGGYITSPEAYYSSLPLPDLPHDAYYDHSAGQRGHGRGRAPAWI